MFGKSMGAMEWILVDLAMNWICALCAPVCDRHRRASVNGNASAVAIMAITKLG